MRRPPAADGPLALIDARRPGAWLPVGGIPLVGRTLYHLACLEIAGAVVLLPPGRPPADLRRWQGRLEVRQWTIRGSLSAALLAAVGATGRLLYVDAAHLFDPRLLRALAVAPAPTVLRLGAEVWQRRVPPGASLASADLERWVAEGMSALHRAAVLLPGDLDPFSPELRGPLVPYCLEVRREEDARRATWTLIRSQQKRVMDFPARYLDPPLENLLTWVLCRTPVTPNMVTLAGAAASVGVAWLFWHGHFLAGALGMFAVEVLDGVDGKLARTTLRFSRFGEHEDLLDYFCENGCYAALAVGLGAAAGARLPALLAGALIAADTADNIFYTLAGRWHGRSIDLFGPFDAAFRSIAGRRNIYGLMFLCGFALGRPLATLAAVTSWGVVTAVVHGIRLFRFSREKQNSMDLQAFQSQGAKGVKEVQKANLAADERRWNRIKALYKEK